MPIDFEEYKVRKLKAFEYRPRKGGMNEKHLAQRNLCFKMMMEKGIPQTEIAQTLAEGGYKISQSGISKAIEDMTMRHETY